MSSLLLFYVLLIPLSLAGLLMLSGYFARSHNEHLANIFFLLFLPLLVFILGLALVLSPFAYVDFLGGFLLILAVQILVSFVRESLNDDT